MGKGVFIFENDDLVYVTSNNFFFILISLDYVNHSYFYKIDICVDELTFDHVT